MSGILVDPCLTLTSTKYCFLRRQIEHLMKVENHKIICVFLCEGDLTGYSISGFVKVIFLKNNDYMQGKINPACLFQTAIFYRLKRTLLQNVCGVTCNFFLENTGRIQSFF